jgi:hypothetical protein
VRLKEHRPAQARFNGGDGRVEAFQVPDLHNAVVLFRQCDDLVGFGQRCGQRLFNEQIESACEQLRGDRVVIDRRNSYVGSVQMQVGGEQRAGGREDGNRVLLCDLGCAGRIGLQRGNQRNACLGQLQLTIDAQMIAAKCACACNCNSNWICAAYCSAPFPSTAFRQRA